MRRCQSLESIAMKAPVVIVINREAEQECYCSSGFKPPWLFFLPTFMPLSRPSFFHIPLSLLCRGLWLGEPTPRSPTGGEVGGVIGLSFVGLPVLPLSSVIPGPLVVALRFASDDVPSGAEVANGATLAGEGEDVVGESFMLKRALLSVVVSVEGADFRLTIEGAV